MRDLDRIHIGGEQLRQPISEVVPNEKRLVCIGFGDNPLEGDGKSR
jgi:hypothetical protein